MKQYDPQMHTTEHILNQTMVRLFGCDRSFSMHLERKKSKCDYHFNRALTPEEEQVIEKQVNEVISGHLAVTSVVVPRHEAEQFLNLKRLPEEAADEVRIIRVGDYDECACSGDHVTNTSEIGKFVWVSSSFEDGVLRIRFKLNRP
jgi:alanyl-tRNA synthetase